jgi:pilus assembly protein Flp/PilA
VNHIRRFLVSEDGPTAIEYAVMLALIIVVCVGTIQMMGCSAGAAFYRLSRALGN